MFFVHIFLRPCHARLRLLMMQAGCLRVLYTDTSSAAEMLPVPQGGTTQVDWYPADFFDGGSEGDGKGASLCDAQRIRVGGTKRA